MTNSLCYFYFRPFSCCSQRFRTADLNLGVVHTNRANVTFKFDWNLVLVLVTNNITFLSLKNAGFPTDRTLDFCQHLKKSGPLCDGNLMMFAFNQRSYSRATAREWRRTVGRSVPRGDLFAVDRPCAFYSSFLYGSLWEKKWCLPPCEAIN